MAIKNFRTDAEFIQSVRGYAGRMYSVRIQNGDRTGLEEGVPNGTFLFIGDLEEGEREIRKAVKATTTELPAVVIRGEVNPAEYVLTDGLWGKFRMNPANPLPVAQLSVGDFLGLSEDYFPEGEIASIVVGDKYELSASTFVAGSQLVKQASPAGVYFEVVEVKNNMIPTYLLPDGKLTKPYKMISVEVKRAA